MMAKKPVIGRPADLDAFVSGADPARTPEKVGTSEPPKMQTPTGSEVQPAEGRRRKADAWGMPRPGEKIAKVGVDLTEAARRAFKAKAAAEGRDIADLIRAWIRDYVQEKQE
jgi:hypothetical protein